MEELIHKFDLDFKPKSEPIIKKVPGKILPIPAENNGNLGDLSKKTTVDLQELLERQNKILTNRSLVKKLEDKGKKVLELKERIEQELKSREEIDKFANLFSEINLGQLNHLEWTGNCKPGYRDSMVPSVDDCRQEETDALKILATHCGTTACEKQISITEPEESLIKLDDCNPTKDVSVISSSLSTASLECDTGCVNSYLEVSKRSPSFEKTASALKPHQSGLKIFVLDEPEQFAHSICERYGCKESKERFKLNKPIKPFSGAYQFQPPGRVSSKPRQWEETNVTPPLPVYGDIKLLPLDESLEIQRQQKRKLKEIQIKHAAEKLSSLQGIRFSGEISTGLLPSMAYRDQVDSNSDSEVEVIDAELQEQEQHDEDQQDHGTTVVYNVEM